ncbi:MAG: rhodanese-like domain-containing protein [Candidatus Paceibacterota bacterium]
MKAQELKEKLQKGEDVRIFDVREKEEYDSQEDKMEGAENMPMGKVFEEASKGNLPKDKRILAVCKSGTRCEIVAKELQKKGYDIDYLEGGIKAWKGIE